jgi:hypothetical protein
MFGVELFALSFLQFDQLGGGNFETRVFKLLNDGSDSSLFNGIGFNDTESDFLSHGTLLVNVDLVLVSILSR